MFALAFPVLCLSLSCLVFLFCLHKIKALFISNAFTVSREVENGEGASFVFNTYIWDTQESMFKRYQKLVGAVEARKAFCHARFERLLEEERQKGA